MTSQWTRGWVGRLEILVCTQRSRIALSLSFKDASFPEPRVSFSLRFSVFPWLYRWWTGWGGGGGQQDTARRTTPRGPGRPSFALQGGTFKLSTDRRIPRVILLVSVSCFKTESNGFPRKLQGVTWKPNYLRAVTTAATLICSLGTGTPAPPDGLFGLLMPSLLSPGCKPDQLVHLPLCPSTETKATHTLASRSAPESPFPGHALSREVLLPGVTWSRSPPVLIDVPALGPVSPLLGAEAGEELCEAGGQPGRSGCWPPSHTHVRKTGLVVGKERTWGECWTPTSVGVNMDIPVQWDQLPGAESVWGLLINWCCVYW